MQINSSGAKIFSKRRLTRNVDGVLVHVTLICLLANFLTPSIAAPTASNQKHSAQTQTQTQPQPQAQTQVQAQKFNSADRDSLAKARHLKDVFEDEESIKEYTKYLAKHPEDAAARSERAEEYRNEHRFNECIADLNVLLKSKDVGVARNAATDLGKLYQKMGKYAQAIQTFKFARSIGVTTLLTEISDCARLSGDNETALSVSNEIIKSGRTFDGKLRRAQALMAMNQLRPAMIDLNWLCNFSKGQIAKVNPESSAVYDAGRHFTESHEARAKCYDLMKQPELAKKDRDQIKTLNQQVYNESPFLTKDKK